MSASIGIIVRFLTIGFQTMTLGLPVFPQIMIGNDDSEVKNAVIQAHLTLAEFTKVLGAAKQEQNTFSVMVPIEELGESTKYAWLYRIEYFEGKFIGKAVNRIDDNDAEPVEVSSEQCADWLFVDNGWLVGGYTIRILIGRMSEEEQQDFLWRMPFCISETNRNGDDCQFMDAIGNHQTSVVTKLLDDHPEFLNLEFLVAARQEFDPTMRPKKMSPLKYAIRYGNAETVNLLLARGADSNYLDSVENTVLFDAVMVGRIELFRGLIARGADVNARNRIDNTPIRVAVGSGNLESVNELLQLGANPKYIAKRDGGKSLAHSLPDKPAMVDLLFKAGVDFNALNENGDNALHIALENEFGETAVRLAELGANIFAINNDGIAPIELAKRSFGNDFAIRLKASAKKFDEKRE